MIYSAISDMIGYIKRYKLDEIINFENSQHTKNKPVNFLVDPDS